MASVVEESGLTTRTEQSFELTPTAGAAEKQYEIQSAIVIAKRFPRNEDGAFQKLMKAALRPSFAEDSYYSFPRGKKKDEATGEWVENLVEGKSVYLLREAARIWGNIRYGTDVIADDDDSRTIRSWAWDLETNTRPSQETTFKKLIQRKQRGGGTIWVKPDERDLRELTNKLAAIGERNCLDKVLPSDFTDDALAKCKETEASQAKQDPDAARKKIILAFSQLNITPEMLETKLGHPLAQCSPAEIAQLRGIYKSIADGHTTWSEYVEKKAETEKGTLNVSDLKPGKEENRGHGNENLSEVAKPSEKPQDAPKSKATPSQAPKKNQPTASAQQSGSGNPNYAESDPFADPAMGGELFGNREPGSEG